MPGMTAPFHILAIDGSSFIGLVIMGVWIWLAVSGKRSKPGRHTDPPPLVPAPREAEAPQDELRKFFEDLEKGLKAPPPAEPAETFPAAPVAREPQPPAPPPAPRPAQRRALRTAPAARPRPVMAAPVPVATFAPPELPVSDDPQVTQPVRLVFPDARLEGGLGAASAPVLSADARRRLDMLRRSEGLKDAIVLSEILGRPVGLRG